MSRDPQRWCLCLSLTAAPGHGTSFSCGTYAKLHTKTQFSRYSTKKTEIHSRTPSFLFCLFRKLMGSTLRPQHCIQRAILLSKNFANYTP
uniref:Putative secreted protein n=1 Tax=Ixodes ricinus TaxID=34613 RepID=A0A6B0UGF9_IXORI